MWRSGGQKEAEQFTRKHKMIVMIDNTVVRAPMALINIDTPSLSGEVDAMWLEDAIYEFIIGNVPGARQVDDPDAAWKLGVSVASVETRAEAERTKVLSPLKVLGHPEEAVTPERVTIMQADNSSLERFRDIK